MRRIHSTTIYKRGDVVVAELSFSDRSGAKRRPVLVVSDERFHARCQDVIVSPITRNPRYFSHPGPGDVPIAGWQAAGLRRPSTVRVSKTGAVDRRIISRAIGRMPAGTFELVERALREALNLP